MTRQAKASDRSSCEILIEVPVDTRRQNIARSHHIVRRDWYPAGKGFQNYEAKRIGARRKHEHIGA